MAKILNDFQNHRTETDYQDSLVSTIFVVQFALNFFYSTFFAFVKPFHRLSMCGSELHAGVISGIANIPADYISLQ